MNPLFFFYVRKEKYDLAWEMYDGASDLWSLQQKVQSGIYGDREHVYDEDKEEVTDEETVLYSFAMGDALDQWRVIRIMNWIGNGLEL
jgi:hypothetical protein